nr:MAG TPA: hypothetical protein [Caudoviricetes sp.]
MFVTALNISLRIMFSFFTCPFLGIGWVTVENWQKTP